MSVLQQTVEAVRPADREAVEQAWRRRHGLTRPRGVFEEPGARLAGTAGTCQPPVPQQAAARVPAEVSTFDAAGVTDKDGAP